MTGFRAGIIRQLYNKKQPFQTSVKHGCFGRTQALPAMQFMTANTQIPSNRKGV